MTTENISMVMRKRARVLAIGTDRQAVIETIKEALKRRSGKAWSVTGGRGTAYGWITIQSPPSRRLPPFDYMTADDCAELGQLLGLGVLVHQQGESIPDDAAHYRLYLARALYGESLGFTATPAGD